MSSGAEYSEVEKPLLDQLVGLGWSHIEGSKSEPVVTGRESFRESLIENRLREALRQINLGPDGNPWLDDSRLSEAVSSLTRTETGKLIEINERMTERLLEGTSVAGLPDWDQGRSQHIKFIDFDNPEHNDFLAINQFRMDEPGGQAKKFVAPDVVLFVNGIPLVVIECKSPYVTDPMAEGINQLRRYANQRDLGVPEGNEQLFWTNQFVVSTYGDKARVGTFTSEAEHFLEWKDAAPLSRDHLAARLGKPAAELTGQELLVAGMLTPANLLDIVRHYTLFTEVSGRRIKLVARYQQYRAVLKALNRLRTGKTRQADGEHDRRGGLIWHTQGSGKSLTMVFLVRAMRSDPVLRAFKVVVITDRTDLEKQLAATAKLSGETVQRARKSAKLRTMLAEQGPALVFAMIHKYRDTDTGKTEQGLADDEKAESFGVINTDESIVILVDEAHRSQTSTLHANLMAALPNAAKIGFTGTPIMREGKKRTEAIFGEFIDKYTIRQAEADGAVVPILYEGRTAKGAVAGGSDLDELFEDMFADLSDAELEKLKARYATTGSVVEAPQLIAAKAKSMLWHYVSTVMPNGFKAQVAASSRLATVRYREALLAARDDLVAQIEALPDHLRNAEPEEIDRLDRKTQILVRAADQLDLLKGLDFVPVISSTNNDDPTWAQWTDKARQDAVIEDFKKDLGLPGEKTSPVAFLIVRTMLLTGFDAPVEQVLYLDRAIQDAELLQAIARVNRTASRKTVGLLVDYYGVGAHLQKALKAYAPEDAEDAIGALASIKDELPKLRDRHARVIAVFAQAGIDTFDTDEDVEACVQVLADEALRARFGALLKQFLTTLDTVMPRPEALPFVHDAKRLGIISLAAKRRYRDDGLGDFDSSLYGEKVRRLIDEHVTALDIATKIPPVSVTDPDFIAKVKGLTSDKAKASEMEHALRYHIRKNFDEDPARYTKLSERLDDILKNLTGQWDQLALALTELLSEAQSDEGESTIHDDPLVARFYGLLEAEFATDASLPEEVRVDIVHLAQEIVVQVEANASMVRFWHNPHAQETLRKQLIHTLDDRDLFPFEEQAPLADKLMELAKANQSLIASRRR
ncbi:type I restriction endonuclease subunit R [Mycobacteroides abscessus]|uniref:Type I restriction enzyme endonuclease subunit n=3 Tax=Mycobacteroides abscessus TaxID=36809 RepID=A0A0U0ZQI7_9MYCO|nr:HsdR family type I site-specific deoxyribonuclease [Mycobacteroides abscessus]MBL3733893.1 type I restriction endonuclease subunit R [Mycobacteroides abscessus subsp. massiliense]MBL3745102.1 type I restriction endonuclease subunit R [Mycobacteroides abscessus subsp. massiliense]MBL3760587.1 type I restriction endonuclease subunit R [Mycobacteroides abscessus subsp. massiliense]MBN7481520.1 type I restriction endonuclease subunit R [Mycobacteroides abscessus subsp. massiliense]MDB2217013.1 